MARNPKKSPLTAQQEKSRGNAMVYVLIAIALFGFLTITMARQNNQADGQDLSDEQVDLYVNELINYMASAQQVVDMMQMSGSQASDLVFLNPASAGFDTAPHIHKVYHPAGGGLNAETTLDANMFSSGLYGLWRMKNNTNVEWTPTTNDDVILSNQFLKEEVCAAYNKKVTGSETIPQLSNTLDYFFAQGSTNDFDATDCAACDGYPTLCVQSSGGTSYGVYSVIAAE